MHSIKNIRIFVTKALTYKIFNKPTPLIYKNIDL